MSVKVSSKYQVVISDAARRALNLRPGTMVDVVVKGGVAFLVRVKSIQELSKRISGLNDGDLYDLREKKPQGLADGN